MAEILKSEELNYTRLEFYNNYVISHIREGVILNKDLVQDLVVKCSKFYKQKNYTYFSKRIENYNVDPTVYFNLEYVGNLKGIAIACTSPTGISMARFEKGFSKLPFEIFFL